MTDTTKTNVVSVEGGFHLVTHGSWQVSVMSDGMISLPKLVRPQDVDEFIGAMQAAQEVAMKQYEDDQAKQEAPGNRSSDKQDSTTPVGASQRKVKSVQGPRGSQKAE